MIYAILAMLIWATTAIQIRLIKTDFLNILFWSNIIALLPAFLLFFLNFKKLSKMFIAHKLILFAVGLFAFINGFTYFYSIKNTTIANALMTHYTTPIIVAVFAPIFLKEKFTIKILIALISGIIGLLLIINQTNLRFNSNDFYGIICGLISAFAYAAVILIGRFFKTNINPVVYIISQSSVAVIFSLPFINLHFWNFDKQSIIFIITFGLFNIFLAAVLFFKSLTKVNASIVGIIGYIEPIGAIIIGIIFLNEIMTLKILIGCLLVIISSVIVSIK
ncbi:MAG TPA: DMT family transporter [bacterium]|nr:DMT family transporter [bacterium]HOL47244.1 DMT family transporter [bacterium]HPQ19280.1 DMT family transporter [bacterium]